MWFSVLISEKSVERNREGKVGQDRTGLDKRAISNYNICCSDYMKLSKYAESPEYSILNPPCTSFSSSLTAWRCE